MRSQLCLWGTILSLSLFSILHSLEPLPYVSPQDLATGTLTALSNNPSSAVINPIAGRKGLSTSVQYINSMINLPLYGINAILGGKNFAILSGARFLDIENYLTQNYMVGFRWEEKWYRIGCSYNALFDKIEGYDSVYESFFKAGLRLNTDSSTLDLCAENLFPSHLDNAERIPEWSLNYAQWLYPTIQTAVGASFTPHQREVWTFGTRTYLTTGLQTIITWQSNPSQYAYCIVLDIKSLRISYAVKTHPELNWTQSLGLTWNFQ